MMYYKNHTHVKNVGHTSEFPFDTDWLTLKNPKNQNFEKVKKKKKEKKWRYHRFSHFTENHYQVQSLRYGVTQFFHHLGPFFFSFPQLPNTPENQNFEKKKKASWDIIILNLRNKKHNQMIYAYSDILSF